MPLLLLLLLLLLLMMMMLMLIILELIKAPHLNTTIQGAPHSFLYPFIKSLLFQKIIYFFCFSLAFKRPIFHCHHPASRQMSNQGTQILFILTFTNLRIKKTFFRAATHAAHNNQIGTREPRLKPSPADAAHIW